jgi:hypothetical protein
MNTIIRKYNYKLETGLVGTDDDNIANILYNINRMEMTASGAFPNEGELNEALGGLFFMIVDSKVHLNRFLKIFENKTNAASVATVKTAFDDALQIVRADGSPQADAAKKSAVFPRVYRMLLDIVPSVLALDTQAAGRTENLKT